jgi:hypothetical protein
MDQGVAQSFWFSDTAESLGSVAAIGEWANHADRLYSDAAKSHFMGSADLRLIAQAHAMGATVVTREVSAPEAKKIVEIPDVCAAIDVACSQPFPMYRALGLKLG